MKKIAIGFLVLSLAVLLFLTVVLDTGTDTNGKQEQQQKETLVDNVNQLRPANTNGDVRETPEFQSYYYDQKTDELSWELRGDKSRIEEKSKNVWITEPVMTYYSRKKKGDTRQVDIVANKSLLDDSEKKARLHDEVLLESSGGGTLTTDRLISEFDQRNVYTEKSHFVTVQYPNITLEGYGFTGNTKLKKFRVLDDVKITIGGKSRKPSGKTQKNDQKQKRRSLDRTTIHTDGPVFMRKVIPARNKEDSTSSAQKPVETDSYWKVRMPGGVFLQRFTAKDPIAIRSRKMVIYLTDQKKTENTNGKTEEKKGDRRDLTVRRIEADGDVYVEEPRFEMEASHMLLRKQQSSETIDIKGSYQRVHFRRGSSLSMTRNQKEETMFKTGREPTEVTFTGEGKITRYFPEANQTSMTERSRSGEVEAAFQENVRVSQEEKTLFSERLTVELQRQNNKKEQAEKGQNKTLTVNRPNNDDQSEKEERKNPSLQLQEVTGENDVLLLEENIASEGDWCNWNFSNDYIQLTSSDSERVEVADLQNFIRSRQIDFRQKEKLLIAEEDVESRFLVRKGDQLGSVFPEEATRKDTGKENSRNPWNIASNSMAIHMKQQEASRFGRVEARGDVNFHSGHRSGHGDVFILDKDQPYGVLKSRYIATLKDRNNRIRSDRIEFMPDENRIHFRGRTSMRLAYNQRRSGDKQKSGTAQQDQQHEAQKSGAETSPSKKQAQKKDQRKYVHIVTKHPVVAKQEQSRLSFLGFTRMSKPNSYMRADRMYIDYGEGDERRIKDLRASGDVWVNDRKGIARGDMADWKLSKDRLVVRGQPTAYVFYQNTPVQFEIVKILENWSRFTGEQRKWKRAGSIRRKKDENQ